MFGRCPTRTATVIFVCFLNEGKNNLFDFRAKNSRIYLNVFYKKKSKPIFFLFKAYQGALGDMFTFL